MAHTVRGGESFLVSLERGLRGVLEPAFPPEYPLQRMNEVAAWDTSRIMSTMRTVDERFQRDLSALRPGRLGTRGHHPYGLMTARWFVDQRLAELEDAGLLAVSGDRTLADRFAEILPGP